MRNKTFKEANYPVDRGTVHRRASSSLSGHEGVRHVSKEPSDSSLHVNDEWYLSIRKILNTGSDFATRFEYTIGYTVIIGSIIAQGITVRASRLLYHASHTYDKIIFALNIVSIVLLIALFVVTLAEHFLEGTIQNDFQKNVHLAGVVLSLTDSVIGIVSSLLSFWNYGDQSRSKQIQTFASLIIAVLSVSFDAHLFWNTLNLRSSFVTPGSSRVLSYLTKTVLRRIT